MHPMYVALICSQLFTSGYLREILLHLWLHQNWKCISLTCCSLLGWVVQLKQNVWTHELLAHLYKEGCTVKRLLCLVQSFTCTCYTHVHIHAHHEISFSSSSYLPGTLGLPVEPREWVYRSRSVLSGVRIWLLDSDSLYSFIVDNFQLL